MLSEQELICGHLPRRQYVTGSDLIAYMLPDSRVQPMVTVVKGGGYEKDNELTPCGGTNPGGNVLILVCYYLFISSWDDAVFMIVKPLHLYSCCTS